MTTMARDDPSYCQDHGTLCEALKADGTGPTTQVIFCCCPSLITRHLDWTWSTRELQATLLRDTCTLGDNQPSDFCLKSSHNKVRQAAFTSQSFLVPLMRHFSFFHSSIYPTICCFTHQMLNSHCSQIDKLNVRRYSDQLKGQLLFPHRDCQ